MPGRVELRKRANKRQNFVRRDEAAYIAFVSLLRADRCVFEASEVVEQAKLQDEHDALDQIRELIARSLNRLQMRAYKAVKPER